MCLVHLLMLRCWLEVEVQTLLSLNLFELVLYVVLFRLVYDFYFDDHRRLVVGLILLCSHCHVLSHSPNTARNLNFSCFSDDFLDFCYENDDDGGDGSDGMRKDENYCCYLPSPCQFYRNQARLVYEATSMRLTAAATEYLTLIVSA